MRVVRQHDQRDCGAACLSMIAAHYGLKLPISRCRELTKTDKSGTNLYGLVSGAEKIGLKAEGLSGSPDELLEGISGGEITFPFIAHIVSEDAMLHYVVVYGLKRGKFLIADPGKGKCRVALAPFFSRWTGYLVTFEKTAGFRRGNETKGSFTKFFAMLKGQYRKLALILALSLLISAIGILGSFVFQLVLDGHSAAYEESVPPAAVEDGHGHEDESPIEHFLESITLHAANIGVVFSALIGLYLLQAGIQLARSYLIILLSRKVDIRLTLTYYNHIMELPVSSVAVRQTGEYLSRFSDTATIRQAISTATLTLLMDSLMVAACGFILYTQNPRLFCVSLLMILFYAVIVLCFRKPIERSSRNVMEQDARLQSFFKESIDGVETVKAAHAEEQIKDKTTGKFYSFIDAVLKNSIISASQDTLTGAVELVGSVVILWLGFSMAWAGQVSTGSVVTFYALLAYFTEPIKNLIELQPTLQTAFVAADRLNDILELERENMAAGNALDKTVDCWEFRNVDFRYGNRELTLHDIDLTLRRGEKIAIVGESGSGKTTLAKLLLRFYEPERGEILANGKKISTLSLAALRRSIAYVDQSTFLFADTVMNNLRLGNKNASESEVRRACEVSCAAEFIEKLPLGYETPLDENGANLSGGQRQRLAIARALLRDPQLLILDEATSNLDTITETGIKNTIFRLDANLTCIIIAHRLTTVKSCDRIYVMREGRIAEYGTHDELLKANGLYRQMWDKQ